MLCEFSVIKHETKLSELVNYYSPENVRKPKVL